MKLSVDVAKRLVRKVAARKGVGKHAHLWEERVEELSRLCAAGISSTHIAFLGTSILAKAMSPEVDLFAIKPAHAGANERAYSARSLCHSVLVPLAAELGINLGVTGREPLNNQPYFRMTRLGDGTPVHPGAKAAFDYMLGLVTTLQKVDVAEATEALWAFVEVRRRYQPRYAVRSGAVNVTASDLPQLVHEFVAESSEDGRRAQAAVAGLFDVFAQRERVTSGRINDPSRNYPGDVCVGTAELGWEKAVEVRDKPVALSDVYIFAKKCVDLGVREAAVVMAAPSQQVLDSNALDKWAADFGIGITLFYGWSEFVDAILFWSPLPKPQAAALAVERIEERLIAVEASPEAISSWQRRTR